VRQRFDHCCEVVDTMADRAGSMPKCTNKDPSNLDLDVDDDGPDFPFTDDDDEEDNDDRSVDVVVAAAAAAAGAASAAPTSKNKKKPRKRGGKTPLMDDATMQAFALANNTSAKQFREETDSSQPMSGRLGQLQTYPGRKRVAALKLSTHVDHVATRVKSVMNSRLMAAMMRKSFKSFLT